MIKQEHLNFIMQAFRMDDKALAKVLNVAPFTVSRWKSGESEPAGLQDEVLTGLYNVAVETSKKDKAEQEAIIALVALGIGALLFFLLMSKK